MGTWTGLLDLERHYAFYGAYHSNRVNILIHILCVWPLHFSFLVLFHFTPPLYNLPSEFNNHCLVLNFGFLYTLIFALFYVCLDNKAGSLSALICVLDLLGWSQFSCKWSRGFPCHGSSWWLFSFWAGQDSSLDMGSLRKEHQRALMNGIVQAFLMGPYFVLLEVLQSAFGYEPYPGFNASVKEKIEANIKEWKVKNQKKLN